MMVMRMTMMLWRVAVIILILTCGTVSAQQSSLIGDPSMLNPDIRVMIESWNFCNYVGPPRFSNTTLKLPPDTRDGYYYSSLTTPRFADCQLNDKQLVTSVMNHYTYPEPLPGHPNATLYGFEYYGQEKARYLGDVCRITGASWSYWTLMLKSGNLNVSSGLCPNTTPPRSLSSMSSPRGVFSHRAASDVGVGAPGPMNQPIIYHQFTRQISSDVKAGGMYGTYDLTNDGLNVIAACIAESSDPHPCAYVRGANVPATFFSSTYTRQISAPSSSWHWRHQIKTSPDYPWLMLYHRADSVDNGNGGYPWKSGGMLLSTLTTAAHPHWYLQVYFNITSCTSPSAQFYLPEVGGCWKNDGKTPCDGDLTTDVTHYVNFIVNPYHTGACGPKSQSICPPFHRLIDGTKVYRNDTSAFPYSCYSMYCAAPGVHLPGTGTCDPYSNPNPQELIQILPCDEWTVHGFPKHGEGWIGDGRKWTLDVGALASRLYYYVNSTNVDDINHHWVSAEIGPEVYQNNAIIEWEIADFNILTSNGTEHKTLVAR